MKEMGIIYVLIGIVLYSLHVFHSRMFATSQIFNKSVIALHCLACWELIAAKKFWTSWEVTLTDYLCHGFSKWSFTLIIWLKNVNVFPTIVFIFLFNDIKCNIIILPGIPTYTMLSHNNQRLFCNLSCQFTFVNNMPFLAHCTKFQLFAEFPKV